MEEVAFVLARKKASFSGSRQNYINGPLTTPIHSVEVRTIANKLRSTIIDLTEKEYLAKHVTHSWLDNTSWRSLKGSAAKIMVFDDPVGVDVVDVYFVFLLILQILPSVLMLLLSFNAGYRERKK